MILREKYLSLAHSYPELFRNPPRDGFRIITDDAGVAEIEAIAAERLQRKGCPAEWGQIGVVYQDEYMLILRDGVQFPDGRLGTYMRIIVGRPNTPPGVVILPTYADKILLIRHYRHATRDWHFEIPRGFGEAGISLEENARRELHEEIGAVASELISLGSMHVNTGLSSEKVELFFARLESLGKPAVAEAIAELVSLEFSELDCLVLDGSITDSFTIAAYARARLRGLIPLAT